MTALCVAGRPHAWQAGYTSVGEYVGQHGAYIRCAACGTLDYDTEWPT